MQKIGFSLLILVLGGVIGWLIKPTEGKQIINNNEYVEFVSDTVTIVDSVEFETIEYVNVKPTAIRDTIYIDTVDRTYVNDLVAEYECLTDQLISAGFERIKTYNEITDDGDSIYIELETVKDLILKANVNLAAREVVSQNVKTYYLPTGTKEEWYIKPAIALSAATVGYIVRGNVK